MTKSFLILSNVRKAALLTGCFFVLGCENDEATVKALTEKKLGIEEGTYIESYLSQNGKVRAKLMAPKMLRYQLDTPKVEFPKSLHVDFYDSTLQIESKLDARYGRYLENENRVFLKDDVRVFNIKGDTLFCEELYWDQLKGLFYTDKPVRIHKPDQKINGRGLVADQAFKWFTLQKVYDSYADIKDSSFATF